MSAIIPLNGKVRQLDRRAEPDELVTEDQARDPKRVARLLAQLLRDVASLKRRFWARHIDFEDRTVDATGTTPYRFPHGFNGRVRWSVVDWVSASDGPRMARDTTSDANTLVLVSYEAGTVTIRVEEAG